MSVSQAVKQIINELHPTLLGNASLNAWTAHNSSSRTVMFTAQHLSQALTLLAPETNTVQTGVEREYGKYTFSIKVDKDSYVVKNIPRYQSVYGSQSIKCNPSNLLILEDMYTGEVDILNLPYHSNGDVVKHQHFGFKYIYNPDIVDKLIPGNILKAGTIIADSSNVGDAGEYRFGINANVAYMSVPGTIEDGFIVSESFCERMKTRKFERRTASWGKKYYPINLYGNDEVYKPFPDIGDKIRPDGLLFVLRPIDETLGAVEMNKLALVEPDHTFDKLYYGAPNATVVDIDIHHSDAVQYSPTPLGMETQCVKYYNALKNFHQDIVNVYEELYQTRGSDLKITPAFHRQVVESMAYIGFENITNIDLPTKKQLRKRKVNKTHRCVPIDDWWVNIETEEILTPTVAFKITNPHGGKGVICSVLPDSEMPRDKAGNIADVIMDNVTVPKRMNLGAMYEQYIKGSIRELTVELGKRRENNEPDSALIARLQHFYSIVNPEINTLLQKVYGGDLTEHLNKVIKDGVHIWLPTDTYVDSVEMVKALKTHFPAVLDKVHYKGQWSETPILIAPMYILLLEKTGSDWSAVDSAKLQHFGLPAKISNADKFSNPGRNNPVRILGETEVRLTAATMGSDAVVDIMELSTSPVHHKEHIRTLLNAEHPTNIENAVDKSKLPVGSNRALLFVNHMLECSGIKFKRTDK